MDKLAHAKDLCPNAACPDYRKLLEDQIEVNHKKEDAILRWLREVAHHAG